MVYSTRRDGTRHEERRMSLCGRARGFEEQRPTIIGHSQDLIHLKVGTGKLPIPIVRR